MDLIPEVMQRDLDQLPTFNLVVGQVIAYLFSLLCTSSGDQVHATDQVTGESVYNKLVENCGLEWVRMKCGTDVAATHQRFEAAIVHWLQDRLDGERSRKQKPGLLTRIMKLPWPRAEKHLYFRGQRVYARWVTDTGTLDTAVNRTAPDPRGFPGTVVGEGSTAGYWRVAFDGEPDHPNIPGKHIKVRGEGADSESESDDGSESDDSE